MKKIIGLLVVFLLIATSCKKNKNTELDTILITVLKHEKKIGNLKEDYEFNISEKLRKLEIYVPSTAEVKGVVPPPLPTEIQYISLLLDLKNDVSTRNIDSLHLLKPIKLTDAKIQIKHSDLNIKMTDLNNNIPNNYYSFSVPIYYSDKSFVYIELENFCQGLCGLGKGILLKKENNIWKIVNWETVWIS